MPTPVTSRETPLYTPSDSEPNACGPEPAPKIDATGEGPAICSLEIASREPESTCGRAGSPSNADPSPPTPPHARTDVDYVTLSVGASEIVGGDLSLTLDRNGHLYFGVGVGVGASATVGSASIHAGQLTEPTLETPSPERVKHFVEGDCVQVSAGIGAEVGVTNGPTGTAVELGVGVPEVGAQFQHNWYVLDLPAKW